MSFVKNLKFFPCLYLGEIVLELVFGDVLDRNQAFPDYQMYKNVNFTWLPNWTCPKGLVLDFCQEFEMFFFCFSQGKIDLEIVFLLILWIEDKPFQTIKMLILHGF